MIKRRGLTRIDLIVTLACAAFVFINAQIISAGGREKAKRDVCMANLRMLTAAWQIYAEDNAGKLVNGAAGGGWSCQSCCNSTILAGAQAPASGSRKNELPWVGAGWDLTNWGNSIPASESQQLCAMQTGALWKYVNESNVYRCPIGFKGELMTYENIDSMNGLESCRGDKANTMIMKNMNQIRNATSRIVYLDSGRQTPDSFAVVYNTPGNCVGPEAWFDLPPVRHGDGTNVSFADGHSAYWKWKAQETIDIAKGGIYGFQPVTSACKQDLYKVQIGCWGKLGYTPTVTPDPNW